LGRVSGRQLGAQLTQSDPAPDVLPEGGDLLVRAELPGVKLENMEITLHAGVLTVSGERKAKEQARVSATSPGSGATAAPSKGASS
jgi:HSP20 family protein